MSETPLSMAEVLAGLEAGGLLDAGGRQRAEDYLVARAAQPPDPIYIRALAGAGAWLAVVFFLACLWIAGAFPQSQAGCLLFGALFLPLAIIFGRVGGRTFVSQLALALIITANSFLIPGLVGVRFDEHHFLSYAIVQAAIAAAIYPFFRDPFYRMVAPLAAVVMAIAGIFIEGAFDWLHLLAGLLALAGWAAFFRFERVSALRPLRYALTLGLMLTTAAISAPEAVPAVGAKGFQAPATAIFAVATALMLLRLGGAGSLRREWMVTALIAVVLLGLFTSPGIMLAIGLLILGYWLDDRVIAFLAAFFLVPFIALYYYALELDLAYKSWVLMGSGAALIAVRTILKTRPWAKEAGS